MLFAALRARGFGDEHVQRYKMVSRFYQQKRPLIVLVCGAPCTGAGCVCVCVCVEGGGGACTPC